MRDNSNEIGVRFLFSFLFCQFRNFSCRPRFRLIPGCARPDRHRGLVVTCVNRWRGLGGWDICVTKKVTLTGSVPGPARLSRALPLPKRHAAGPSHASSTPDKHSRQIGARDFLLHRGLETSARMRQKYLNMPNKRQTAITAQRRAIRQFTNPTRGTVDAAVSTTSSISRNQTTRAEDRTLMLIISRRPAPDLRPPTAYH